jgi:hypothetical protein
MVNKRFGIVLRMSLLAAALLPAASASAGLSYSDVFTAPGSGGYQGSYSAIGEEVLQSFTVPWLREVNSLQLTLNVKDSHWSSNRLNAPLEFSFELNGTPVGSTLYLPNIPATVPFQWEPRHLDFDFAPLFDAAGRWELRMLVSQAQTPCNGCGSITLSSNNPFEISIPEPSGLALIALGLVGVGLFYRRR